MALSQFQTPLPCRLHLRAVNPERNVAREYQLEVQRDLFGHWIVALRWGRIGASGQGRILSFDQLGLIMSSLVKPKMPLNTAFDFD
jgi:predicted DNA-binding WGR domain protein